MDFQENRSFCDGALQGRVCDQKSLAIAIAWCAQFHGIGEHPSDMLQTVDLT